MAFYREGYDLPAGHRLSAKMVAMNEVDLSTGLSGDLSGDLSGEARQSEDGSFGEGG